MTDNGTLLRNFTHITIPAEIWLRRDISMQAKCLWAELRSLHSREAGGCYASDEYIMEFIGLKRSRLHEIYKELKDAGLMEVVSFNGRRTVRKAVVPEVEYGNAQQQCGKVHTSEKKDVNLEDEKVTGQQVSGKPDTSYPENRTPEIRDSGLPTYIYNKEEKKEKTPGSPGSEASLGCARFLFASLKKINNKLVKSEAQIATWAKTIDLMMRIDNRSEEEIRKVIEYISWDYEHATGDFRWVNAVQSAEKLREHFPTIWLRMQKPTKQQAQNQEADDKIKRIKDNFNLAKSLEKKVKLTGKASYCVRENCVELSPPEGGSFYPLGYSEHGFKEQLESFLRKNYML